MKFNKVTHVIFDMDGTLLDTEGIYQRLIKEICSNFGGEFTEDHKHKILGRGEVELATILVNDLQLKCTPEEWRDEFVAKYTVDLVDCQLMPGVDKFVRHLNDHKIPIAVATSSSRESIKVKTSHLQDFFNLFDHIVSGTSDKEVKNGKPAPDIFLYCASLFPDKPDPKECLVIEDAPNGVQGAIAAGMQVVMIPDADLPTELSEKATLVLKSMNDFQPTDFGLPCFKEIGKCNLK